MEEMSANRKALIFTEFRRTQQYLKNFLEANGYARKVVILNGQNNDSESRAIYEQWLEKNAQTGKISGSRTVDLRAALIEHFRDHAEILIANRELKG